MTGIGFAQNTVSGTVVDSEVGVGLPGASVVVKGTSVGVSSDFNGDFSISAESGDILVISYVGYESAEISVDGASAGNIELSPTDNILSRLSNFSPLLSSSSKTSSQMVGIANDIVIFSLLIKDTMLLPSKFGPGRTSLLPTMAEAYVTPHALT